MTSPALKPRVLSAPTLRYAALNAGFWSAFCLLMAFSSLFLLARGLSNTQIGLVLSVSGALSAALQPVVAGLADRSRLPLRFWIVGLTVVIGVAGAALLLPGANPVRDGVLFGVLQCTLQLTLPLVNALGMAAAAGGVDVDFGTARGIGSLAFAATSTGTGVLVAVAGTDAIAGLLVVVAALIIVAAATFVFAGGPSGPALTDAVAPDRGTRDTASPLVSPDTAALDRGTHDTASPLLSRDTAPLDRGTHDTASPLVSPDTAPLDPPALDAAARRRFGVLIAGATGLFISQSAINGFLFQVLRPLGGDSATMGLAFTVAALIEIIPMLFFRQLVARWSPGALLRVSGVGFAAKAALTWFAPNLGVFFVAQTLQLVAFALFVPASVYYVDRLLPRSERARGQSYMTLTLTLGNVLAGLSGGYLLDVSGVPALLGAGAIAAALGAVGVWIGTRHTR